MIIGYVGEDGIWHTDDIYIEEQGDAKIIYSHAEDHISFEVAGNAVGAMNCAIERWENGEPIGRSNFYGIPVDTETEITANIASEIVDGGTLELSTEDITYSADEYISANVNACVSIHVDDSDMGTVTGGGLYVRGDAVVLRAIPAAGYRFRGWYDQSNALVSVSSIYSFVAREDQHYTPRFAEIIPSLENYMVELCAPYKELYDVEITQEETDFTLHLSKRSDDADLSRIAVWFADYNEAGKMSTLKQLSGTSTSGGVDFSGTVTSSGCKLFLLDQSFRPVAEVCISQ